MPRPPPPEVDSPYVFSVSQIQNFERCERLWALEKLDGIKKEDTDATVLGTDVHEQLENYLGQGIAIDTDLFAGQIAFNMLQHLPLPFTPRIQVEEWFGFVYKGVGYRGVMDVRIPTPGQPSRVLDHKTTKDFKWLKTPEELLKDTQAGIYGYADMEMSGQESTELQWTYGRTTGSARKSIPVPCTIYRGHAMRVMKRVDVTAQKIIHVLQTISPGDAMKATPNYTGCDMFGGCQHKDRCKRRPHQKLASIFKHKGQEEVKENVTKNLLANLRKSKEAITGGKTAAAKRPPSEDDDAVQKVNPKEADLEVMTEPPKPRKIGDSWVQATWNAEARCWEWPVEQIEDRSSKSDRASSILGGKKGPSALEKLRAKKALAPPVEEPEEEEEEEHVPQAKKSNARVKESDQALEDAVAALVAAITARINAALQK